MGEFIRWVGPPQITDDGVIEQVESTPDLVVVSIRAEDGLGPQLRVEFEEPDAVDQHRAIGMTLYGLAELTSETERRRFSFVNWEETDDARLEFEARAVRWSTV